MGNFNQLQYSGQRREFYALDQCVASHTCSALNNELTVNPVIPLLRLARLSFAMCGHSHDVTIHCLNGGSQTAPAIARIRRASNNLSDPPVQQFVRPIYFRDLR
jgi:hypothetical protein